MGGHEFDVWSLAYWWCRMPWTSLFPMEDPPGMPE
jgi:hypothetical protein